MRGKQFAKVSVCVVVMASVSIAMADPWTTYQGNASHTGHVAGKLNTENFVHRWDQSFGSRLNPVTAADGKIFVSKYVRFNDTESLFTLDANTGSTLWTKNFGSVNSVNPPAYAYGNVYVQTGNHGDDTFLRAYDANTGNLVFRSPHSAQWERYYAPTIHDGKVFINGGYYGGMYSFDAYTGSQDWFRSLDQYDQWTPAVDEQYAYAYLESGLRAVDRTTGTDAFRIEDPNFDWHGWSMNLAPVLGDSNDAIVIQDGRLLSFDLEEQNIRYEITRSFSGQPTIGDGIVYAIDAGALVAMDELSGAIQWSWEVPSDSLTGTLIVTDSHLFTRTGDDVYAVDLDTHQAVWSYPASGHLTLSEGVLYIAQSNGTLTAIEVPEPASLALLAMGCIALTRKRR